MTTSWHVGPRWVGLLFMHIALWLFCPHGAYSDWVPEDDMHIEPKPRPDPWRYVTDEFGMNHAYPSDQHPHFARYIDDGSQYAWMVPNVGCWHSERERNEAWAALNKDLSIEFNPS